jgi:hypothetical protein
MTSRSLSLWLVLLAAGLSTHVANAEIVGDAILSGSSCGTSVSGSANFSIGCGSGTPDLQGSFANGTGFLVGDLLNPGPGRSITANLEYFFKVVGPEGGTASLNISMVAHTSATASGGGAANSNASISLGLVGSGSFLINQATQASCSTFGVPSCSGPSSFSVNQDFTVSTGTLYHVLMSGSAGRVNVAYAHFDIDPDITFAPGFDSTGFTLNVSPDAAPSPVPLPPSLILMLSGIAAMVALARVSARI